MSSEYHQISEQEPNNEYYVYILDESSPKCPPDSSKSSIFDDIPIYRMMRREDVPPNVRVYSGTEQPSLGITSTQSCAYVDKDDSPRRQHNDGRNSLFVERAASSCEEAKNNPSNSEMAASLMKLKLPSAKRNRSRQTHDM